MNRTEKCNTVIVAGDFCPQQRVGKLFEEGEYANVLEATQKVIAQGDYSIVNFECPVVLGDAIPIVKTGPNLRCGIKAVEALKYAGFDCVTLANNHFYDYANELLSGRLSIGKMMIERYGISLFGQEVNDYGTTIPGTAKYDEYNFIDSSYLRILLKYGLLVFIILCIMNVYVNKRIRAGSALTFKLNGGQ